MRTHELTSRDHAPSTARAGVGFAGLTLVTHAANFTFVVVAGRLLDPGPFSALVALLGIVMLGLAPGMALQALAATGALGGRNLVDRALSRRLGNIVALVVAVVTVVAWAVLSIGGWLVLVAVPLAAGLLPRTAVNEGLLQGNDRFVALGTVMVAGALVKLGTGSAAMAVMGDVGTATAAVALGYAIQLAWSRRLSRAHEPTRDDPGGSTEIAYAVGIVGALLLLLHLDAVVAPALLADLEAGRYGVGVTAVRITFWLPQFAVLLWFPRMVRAKGASELTAALGGVVGLGLLGMGAAVVLGPWLATTVFGPELGGVGHDLWRFVWLGAAGLALQLLTLADLATGNRFAWRCLLPALPAVVAALTWTDPATAVEAVRIVAIVLTLVAGLGAAMGIMATRRHGSRP